MVRHLTQAQHLDSVLSGEGAEQGEMDQMVAVGIEQDAVIGAPLVTMGQDILEKLPTLHISQAEGRRGLLGRISERFFEKAKWRPLNGIAWFSGAYSNETAPFCTVIIT